MKSIEFLRFKSLIPYQAILILPRRSRVKLLYFATAQFFLNIIDLLGIGLIGILLAIGTSGKNDSQQSGLLRTVISFLQIDRLNFKQQALIIGMASILLLITKAFLTLLLLRKLNRFISFQSAKITGDLVLKLLSNSILMLRTRSMQESLWLLTTGVSISLLGVVGRCIAMLGDVGMIIFMLFALLAINPFVAISALIIFGAVATVLFVTLRHRAASNGKHYADLNVVSNQEIYEILDSFRETYVKNRRYFYAEQIKNTRLKLSDTLAMINYLPNLSRYTFDTVVTSGILIFTAIQFYFFDTKSALTSLALFLGASSRIAPSVLRLQQISLELKSASGTVAPLLTLIEELKIVEPTTDVPDSFDTAYEGFEARIAVRNVSFTYPGNDVKALNDVSFDIEANSTYAIVGPSGSGKSTLVDILLGILLPDHGEVEISGVSPSKAIQTWAGAIAYVPQDIVMINNTIAKNISMGYPSSEINREAMHAILEKTQLSEFISNLPAGIDSLVGDRGSKLSGGQRQRLGLARALFTEPKLLFLDEATSALDANTEELVATTILKSLNLTVITIAHRPATIKKADRIIYLDEGKIKAFGTLAQVREKVPEFESLIELMTM